jgi:hypothetical protein
MRTIRKKQQFIVDFFTSFRKELSLAIGHYMIQFFSGTRQTE